MKKLFFIILVCWNVSCIFAQSTALHITLRTIAPISSQSEDSELSSLNCVVAYNVYLNGDLLVSENTPVDTRLDVHKARSRNRVGSITIFFIGVNTVKGGRIFFNESYTKGGRLRKFRWLHGKDAYIPVGTMINVTGIYEH